MGGAECRVLGAGVSHPLAKFATSWRDPNPDGAKHAARRFWQEHGGVAFTAEQLREMCGLDRQFLEAAAVKFYGRRAGVQREDGA